MPLILICNFSIQVCQNEALNIYVKSADMIDETKKTQLLWQCFSQYQVPRMAFVFVAF